MSSTVSTQSPAAVPDDVAGVASLMSTYPATWALCGGWAVDAWLGRLTREHGDVDVMVFDQDALFAHLPGWQLLAHDPLTPERHGEWWTGQRVLSPSSHIHARPPDRAGPAPKGGIATEQDGFSMEFYVNGQDGADWIINETPRIALPLDSCIVASPWDVPVVVPQVLVFYKAQDMRMRDKLDFAALLPQLSDDQRGWLHDALTRTGHPWLPQLA